MIYNKKLNSIEELHAERLKLLKKSEKSFDKENKQKNAYLKGDLATNQLNQVVQSLLGDYKYAHLISAGIDIILPYISKKILINEAKKTAFSLVKEVGLGYAKWKAISLVFDFVLEKIRERKETNK